MRLEPARLGHLTYCTNVHPGVTWDEVRAVLAGPVLAVRDAVAPGRPFGLGLRLAAAASESLLEPDEFARLEDFLARHDLYVFTLNGFPYGPFHGQRVKEEVYQPDWLHEARLTYTDRLADLLARLLPDGMDGSISTVPGTFRPLATAPEAPARIARNLIRHVAHLVELREATGRTIALALEPEPMCLLETIAETVSFFEQHLLGRGAIEQLAALTGLGRSEAETALRRHLGVCYDVCHAAVEFEDPAGSLAALRAAGIAVPKLQLSAAVQLQPVDAASLEALRPFDEPVYLHQVVERRGETLTRHLDLPDAFRASGSPADEWRVHFHVPVFLPQLERFGTTQDVLCEVIALHRRTPVTGHLEVETYTWGVLPAAYRDLDVAAAVARELAWARDQLMA